MGQVYYIILCTFFFSSVGSIKPLFVPPIQPIVLRRTDFILKNDDELAVQPVSEQSTSTQSDGDALYVRVYGIYKRVDKVAKSETEKKQNRTKMYSTSLNTGDRFGRV